MANTIIAQILMRRDSAANWTSINPILGEGEYGIELDTNLIKLGDGTTAWSDLEYTNTILRDPDGNIGIEITSGNNVNILGTISFTDADFEDVIADSVTADDITADNITVNVQLDMTNGRIINVATPVDGSDVATKDYVDNLNEGLQWKSPCKVATTCNITLSGEQTIDGVLTSGDRVLVKDQTDGTENGIYVSDPGAWSRADDADTGEKMVSASTNVSSGDTQADVMFVCTNDDIVLGTTEITFITLGSTISHNNTTGKQGGTTDEYFHLTEDQHTGLGDIGSLVQGGVVFQGATGLTEDSANLFWDNVNKKLGIGESNPSAKLTIKDSSYSSNSIIVKNVDGFSIFSVYSDGDGDGRIYNYDNGGNVKNLINSNGNSYFNGGKVGIGKTEPDYRLDVSETAASSVADLLVLQNNSSTTGTGSRLRFVNSVGVSGPNGLADIVSTRQSDGSTNFEVKTAPGGGASPVSNLYIDGYTGNVGFGDETPEEEISVRRTSGSVVAKFTNSSQGSCGVGWAENKQAFFGSAGIGSISLGNGFGTTYDRLLYVQGPTGNVGIGTTSPLSKLHINGGTGTLSTGLTFGDGDTGIFENVDDSLRFANPGGTRMTIGTSGNIGIGTTSPSYKLDVNGAGSSVTAGVIAGADASDATLYIGELTNSLGYVKFIGASNKLEFGTELNSNPTPAFYINRANANTIFEGNVGIGTTSPQAKLDVDGNIIIGKSGASSNVLNIRRPLDGTIVGTLGFTGATEANELALSHAGGNGYFTFNPGGGVEAMRITKDGNVGIGTTNPNPGDSNTNLLDIGGSSQVSTTIDPVVMVGADANGIRALQLQNQSSGTSAEMRFLTAADDDSYLTFTQPSSGNTGSFFGIPKNEGSFIFNIGGAGRKLAIGTYSNEDFIIGTSATERIRVLSTGEVGINTTTPSEKLDVDGNINATGYITGQKSGAYAYLTAPASTTIDTADEYQYVEGSFANDPAEGFIAVFDTGSITAFADAGGGDVTVTSAAHGLLEGDTIEISGTTNYNGIFVISNVTTNNFDITTTWVANDATGTWQIGPALRYTQDLARWFLVDFNTAVKANINNTLVKASFKKNNEVCACAEMEQFCKNSGQPYALRGIGRAYLEQNDLIQLVVTSDGTGDVITFDMFQADISPKYNR